MRLFNGFMINPGKGRDAGCLILAKLQTMVEDKDELSVHLLDYHVFI